MENINRTSSKDTPEVHFDTKSSTLSIIGNSYPEDCRPIYLPIIGFIESYEIDNNSVLNFKFNFNLINSTSTVYVSKIINMIGLLVEKGLSTRIEWCYDEYDEDLLDLGEKLASISNLEIEFISIEDED